MCGPPLYCWDKVNLIRMTSLVYLWILFEIFCWEILYPSLSRILSCNFCCTFAIATLLEKETHSLSKNTLSLGTLGTEGNSPYSRLSSSRKLGCAILKMHELVMQPHLRKKHILRLESSGIGTLRSGDIFAPKYTGMCYFLRGMGLLCSHTFSIHTCLSWFFLKYATNMASHFHLQYILLLETRGMPALPTVTVLVKPQD